MFLLCRASEQAWKVMPNVHDHAGMQDSLSCCSSLSADKPLPSSYVAVRCFDKPMPASDLCCARL